jgi:hypothetical protein
VDLPTPASQTPEATAASFVGAAGASGDGTVSVDAAITPAGLRREIFGFLPYWEVSSSSLNIVYSRISTIAYFGVGADAAGNLVKRGRDGSVTVGWSGWTSSRMTGVIDAAHRSHTRVVLTVQSFGWTHDGPRPPEDAPRRRRPPAPTSPARSRPRSAIAARTA